MSLHGARTPAIEAFWRAAVAEVAELRADDAFSVFAFGDSEALCEHVLAETLAGRNRATASLQWEHGSRLPRVGDLAVVTDWSGRPRAVLVTRQVDIVRFADVTADFARAEGYAIDPLSEWREVHWTYFSRRCAALGMVASDEMPVVCEWLELLYPRKR